MLLSQMNGKIEHRALSDCYATLEVIQKVLSIAKDEAAAAFAAWQTSAWISLSLPLWISTRPAAYSNPQGKWWLQ
jgi:hypothetical protein